MDIEIYASGMCYTSVCASNDATVEDVIAFVNSTNPTGLNHGWILADETFKDGTPNPCVCNKSNNYTHYLLSC